MAEDALVGTLFGGRWLIERPLVSGGMGSVYVAKHTDTGRAVALKVIKSEVIHEAELTARFRRETAALASLSHPNVVTFLDSGIENGNVFLVMELLAGRSLRDAMFEGPMPHARAFKIGADMCRALVAVHKSGLIHRDLKPENVFLQEAEGHDEIVKLIDFGIVRLDSSHATASTKTGAVVGTPGYISPEQLRGQPATSASDVYAVGVILYEMVTGRSPFDAPDVHAMLVRQLIDPIVPPRELNAALPAHVDAAILRLMERDPAARVASARDALALLMGEAGTAAKTHEGPAQVEGALPPIASASALSKDTRSTPIGRAIEVPTSRRSRAPLIAAAVVASASLAAIAVFVALRTEDAPPATALASSSSSTSSTSSTSSLSTPSLSTPSLSTPSLSTASPSTPPPSTPPPSPPPAPPSPPPEETAAASPSTIAPAATASSKRADKAKANAAVDAKASNDASEAKAGDPLASAPVTPPPLPTANTQPVENDPKARSRVIKLDDDPAPQLDDDAIAAQGAAVRARELVGEKVILSMPGAIVSGGGPVSGVFTVTRTRIAFDSPTLTESFDFKEVLVVEPLVTQSKRAKLILRDRKGRLSSRILVLDDRHTFVQKVNPRARAR